MSLQDTYQSRKNLLASNLTAQGVSASGSEGVTTLANKILNILASADITLTSNKLILSQYDNESATLTATHSKGRGKSVSVYNAVTGSKIGDMTDNNDGTYSYTYNSTGIGDISLTAVAGQTESNSVTIEDCKYFNNGTSLSGITIASGVSCTIDNNECIKITTSTSGEKIIQYPIELHNADNIEIEWEIAKSGTEQNIAAFVCSPSTANGLWAGYATYHNYYDGALLGTTLNMSTVSTVVGGKLKFRQMNGVFSLYHDDVKLVEKSATFPQSAYYCGNYTNQNRIQYLKNIKIKTI